MVIPVRALAVLSVATLALGACASGSSSTSGSGSSGGKTLIISTDLPLQGASADASTDTNNAIKLYLDQIGNKVGKYNIQLKIYDDSTAAKGAYDDATCVKNAQEHVATKNEVAVMGTYNSACAKLEAPILNQDPTGPMLMVSHANTNPGLTKAWDPGEPQKYFPSGVRNYARVITTDDYQGAAAADFVSQDLKVKRCAVLNDNTTYGQGVSKAFVTRAQTDGITILSDAAYDPKQPNYSSVFEAIKAKNPDCVYIGGIYDLNGGQLLKDKVSVLGDNTKVKLIAPDGWTGYPALDKQPQAVGLYATFAGLSTAQLRAAGGAAAKLLDAYKAKYGADPRTDYALYGVAAVQVILAAIEKSDGTRKSVDAAVFSGSGITIPADTSALGKAIVISPQTGDTSAKDISVLTEKAGAQVFVKAQPVN